METRLIFRETRFSYRVRMHFYFGNTLVNYSCQKIIYEREMLLTYLYIHTYIRIQVGIFKETHNSKDIIIAVIELPNVAALLPKVNFQFPPAHLAFIPYCI